MSQIGGRVLWEHLVAGSNPVAPIGFLAAGKRARAKIVRKYTNKKELLRTILPFKKGSSLKHKQGLIQAILLF